MRVDGVVALFPLRELTGVALFKKSNGKLQHSADQPVVFRQVQLQPQPCEKVGAENAHQKVCGKDGAHGNQNSAQPVRILNGQDIVHEYLCQDRRGKPGRQHDNTEQQQIEHQAFLVFQPV